LSQNSGDGNRKLTRASGMSKELFGFEEQVDKMFAKMLT
jgi:hypothetical protein